MAVTSGFFNSVNHDRVYDAIQMSSIFDGIILDGVFESYGDAFQVSPYEDADNTVIVKTGRAWFNHTWTLNDSYFAVVLDPPNKAYSRIDAIVLDINSENDVRKNDILYVKGSYGYNDDPKPPELIKSELHNQYPLAYITVDAAEDNSVISASKINNRVGTSECPIVTAPLEVINGDIYIQQLESIFYEWYEHLQDLDDNAAYSLQTQIDDLKKQLDDTTALGIIPEKYEFAQNCKITEIYNSSSGNDLYTSSGLILPDGYTLFVGQGQYAGKGSVNLTDKSIYATFISPDGVATFSSIATKEYEGNQAGSNCVLCYAEADSYPVKAIFAMDDISDKSSSSISIGCYVLVLTISDAHVISVSPVSQSISVSSSSWIHDPAKMFCSSPAYLRDGGAVVASALYTSEDNYITLSIFPIKVTSSGVISNYASSLSRIYPEYVLNGFILYIDDNDTYLVAQATFRTQTSNLDINSHNTMAINPSTLEKLSDIVPQIPASDIRAWNDTYAFVDSGHFCKVENSYDLTNSVESIPPSIALIMDLSSAATTIGYNGGFITEDKSVMVVQPTSGNLSASLLGEEGLSIWSAPASVSKTIFDGQQDSSMPGESVYRYDLLKHKYVTWTSEDESKFIVLFDGNFGISKASGAGTSTSSISVQRSTNSQCSKYIYRIEKE